MPARCRWSCASDALAAAAEMVLAVEQLALEHARPRRHGRKARSAARRRQRDPRRRRSFTLDLRSPSDAVRSDAVARLKQQFDAIAERRGVSVQLTPRLRRSRRHLRTGAGRSVGERPSTRSGIRAPAPAERRRPRRSRDDRPVPYRHAVRPLQGRHQPQSGRSHHGWRMPTSASACCSIPRAI